MVLVVGLWAEPAGGFAEVDARAVKAPASSERSLAELVRYLCPPGYSERDKARSLFRWVSERVSYDLEGLKNNKMGSQLPDDVLRARKAVCAGYSNLYQALGDKAGLQVATLSGESKFNDQLPLKLPPGVSGHAWNAVFLGGRWQLVDVTWAAGKADANLQFKKGFDDYWFCTPPEQFVCTHLPKDPRWQLLAKPWSKARFDSIPLIRGNFFQLGLQLTPDTRQPLRVSEESQLRWPAPDDVVGMSDLRNRQGQILPNWTFSQSPKGYLETRVRCPATGSYRLQVYGRKRQPAWQGNLQDPVTYPGIAVVQVTGVRPARYPFPKTFGSFQRAAAELVEPFDGLLKGNSRQRFRVRVPGADEVALFSGQALLARLESRRGLFEGVVQLPARGTPPLQMCARFSAEPRYWGLVEYELR
jgi:hypothetical protein